MENEEYDYKLSRNNPALVAKVISNIATVIKNKVESNTKCNCFELAEYKYLKQKCFGSEPAISCAAGDGLVYLTKCCVIEVSKMMSEVTAMIPFAQNHRGLLIVLNELLVMDMESKLQNDNYTCPFNLAIPQHPIISTLVHNIDVWHIVLNHIRKLYLVEDNKFKEALNELFRPVYLFILCDPHIKTSELCRISFLKFLLEENSNCGSLIPSIVGWLQVSSIENQIYSNSILLMLHQSEFVKHDDELRDFILFWLLSFLYELCCTKSDPTEILIALSKLDLQSHRDVDLIILFLAKCITAVQPTYLPDLLKICLKVLPDDLYILSALVLQASLINWMLYPSQILDGCSTLLNKLYNKIKTLSTTKVINFEHNNQHLNLLQNTNRHLYLIIQICQLFPEISSLEEDMSQFLNSASSLSPFLLKQTIPFVSGIFIYSAKNQNITLEAMSLLLHHVSDYGNASNTVLTLFLYKLANCRHTNIQFQTLQGMVQVGKSKENIHVVIATLKALGDSSPQMKTMVLILYFELWKHESKCYFLLQKMLLDENRLDKTNFAITKAHVIKELCKLKAELYGSELAVYISKILNSCKTDNGLASSFALEGLTHLCTKGIIDVTTAWDTLEPSFRTETRSNVIASFCNLLSELQNLYIETAKFDKMTHDVVVKLWNYVFSNSDAKVIEAAYKALATFDVELVSEEFLEMNTNRHISEGYWFLTLLHDNSYDNLDSTANFIIGCLSKEISEYGRGIYHIQHSKAEPSNYDYLSSKSILRGLMKHIKKNYSRRSKVEVACFKILSQEYPKPLPPLDWCFLQEFIHDLDFRQYCIAIGSHQVLLSGTARRFIENLIVAITENPTKDDICCIISNMKHICNSIQPVIIKPFFATTLQYALTAYESGDCSLLDFVISTIKQLMQKSDFQDANKNVIARAVVDKAEEVPLTSPEFEKLIECVSILPYLYVKPLISPKSWPEITVDKLRRGIVLCGYLVKMSNDLPMTYYNEIINIISEELIETEYFLNCFCNVTHNLKDHNSLPNWFLEFLGQTQLEMIDSSNFSQKVSFMCNILIVTIVSISEQKFFLKSSKTINMQQMLGLLPQAFILVLKEEKWNKYTTQVLEWLYYMINYQTIPVMYRRVFYQCLVALRHEPQFKGSLKWLKYIGCRNN